MSYKFLKRISFTLVLCLFALFAVQAQTISGPSCINADGVTVYDYYIGNWTVNDAVYYGNVTGGYMVEGGGYNGTPHLIGDGPVHIRVVFTDPNSAKLTVDMQGMIEDPQSPGSFIQTQVGYVEFFLNKNTLTEDIISGEQVVNYNTVPQTIISSTNVSNGDINYIYEWEKGESYFGPFTSTGVYSSQFGFTAALGKSLFLRRKVSKNCGNIHFEVYSNVIKIAVVSINWEDYNYVREHTVLVAGITDWKVIDQLSIGQKLQSTVYFDGLERQIEKVNRESAAPVTGSSIWGDMVEFYRYDAFGRQPQQYLGYTTTSEIGKFKTNAYAEQPQYFTNNYNETSAFSSITFDNSPLNRLINVKSPGTVFASSLGNSMRYEFNTTDGNSQSTTADNIQILTIGNNSGDIPSPLGYYEANTLYKLVKINENGKKSIEFSNNRGQVIFKKVQIGDNVGDGYDGWICTYNIYDDFGQLRFVLQPEAVKWLVNNNWSFNSQDGLKVLDEFCFRYEYDSKGRMVLKKVPGAKEVYSVYDNRDRVVFTQDGVQRAKVPGQWTANIYDELDRPVIMALYSTAKGRTDLEGAGRSAVTTATITTTTQGDIINDLIVNRRVSGIGSYSAQSSVIFDANAGGSFSSNPGDIFSTVLTNGVTAQATSATVTVFKSPITSAELSDPSVTTIVKYLFYDDYSFDGAKPFDNNYDNSSSGGDPIVATKRNLSMPTGTKVRVLGSNTFLTNTVYYDEKGRLIQTTQQNIKQGQDVTTWQYQFDGRILSVNTKHSTANSGYDAFSVLTSNTYDKLGRIKSIIKRPGAGNPSMTIATYDYDDVGRLKTKHLDPYHPKTTGFGDLEWLSYSYNIHGEMTGINKDYALKTPGKYSLADHFFGLYIGYENRDNVFSNRQMDGHITGTLWTTQGNDAQRRFEYSYDNAGRLNSALFNEKPKTTDAWNNTKMDFSVSGYNTSDGKIMYDLNGNIQGMVQKGVLTGSLTPVEIDKLSYGYGSLSNKLLRVKDYTGIATANGKQGDFVDGSNGNADDYAYDDNGNLIVDQNKGIGTLLANGGGINYNFLDKPEIIRIAGKGMLKNIYDADGNKLQKIFIPDGAQTGVTTTYAGDFVYKDNALEYINFEEGRIRIINYTYKSNGYDILSIDGGYNRPGMPDNKVGTYDFFVRDYLGNIRTVLSEEKHMGQAVCTMETTRSANEEPVFGKVTVSGTIAPDNEVKARFLVSDIPGQANGNGWQNNTSSYVSRVGNLAPNKIGPNVLLKVMSGDYIVSRVQSFYKNQPTNLNNGSSLVNDVVTSLIQAISGSALTGTAHGATSLPDITTQLTSNAAFQTISDPDVNNNSGTKPKAYLSVLFFDEQFNFIAPPYSYNNTMRVGGVSGSATNIQSSLVVDNTAPKNGYAFVYVSNSSDEMVYFDDLSISFTHGPLIEEDHYYPFGLKIAGLSSRKMPDIAEGYINSQNLFNDKELIEDGDLNWYDYGFRSYDPQIGRFPQLDPLADDYAYYSPYQYAGNEPIANIDLDGLEPSPANSVGTATQGAGRFFLFGENSGSGVVRTFLGNLGENSSSWVTTLQNFTITAKKSKALLASALHAINTSANIIDNMAVKGPVLKTDNQEMRRRLSLLIHDQLDPSNPLIWGTHSVGGMDVLAGNEKNGYMWGWRTQAIQEDGGFWLTFMPLPKLALIVKGLEKGGEVAASRVVSRTWNEFQSATAGQFASRVEASIAWSTYKEANGIITNNLVRSQAQKSLFLRNAAASGMYPKWMNQWLRKGKVPPGYHVDHITPLSIGGADLPSNMRLLDIDFHKNIHHRLYRPWE